ncbi:MAG: hypothetical protein IJX66_06320 [Lachnospiraceae bacterium]|nr:hypothetical protein [Lachnospiraceae bacterium]
MICNQCGAEFDSNLLQCPYCHSENRKEAKRQKKQILEGYDREAENIKNEAEGYAGKTAGRWTKKLLLGIGVVLAIGVLLTVVYLFCTRILVKAEYAGKDAQLAKLEELYQAGDYAALSEYMWEEDLYGRDYDKYGELWEVYAELEDMVQDVEHMEQVSTYTTFSRDELWESFEFWSGDYISSAKRAMELSDTYINDRVFRENEDALQSLLDMIVENLTDIGFSREEIDRIVAEDTEDLGDLEEKLFEILVLR